MLERKPAGQEGPEASEPPEARGEDDLAAAFGDGAPTGSHAVAKAGFDTDLPDDADDVETETAAPISSPRVGADEQVLRGKTRRWLPWRRHGAARRSPPER